MNDIKLSLLILVLLMSCIMVFSHGTTTFSSPFGCTMTCDEGHGQATVTPITPNPMQGKPGKQGPVGPAGAVGPTGPPGAKGAPCECEYDQIISELSLHLGSLRNLFSGDCGDVERRQHISGNVQSIIYPQSTWPEPLQVRCDHETDGGRWTIIQRRINGRVNFLRNWTEYEVGFGSTADEYWIGLQNLYKLTNSSSYELRIDLEDFEGNTRYAKYSSISLSDESDNYRLTLGTYSGDAGNSMTHNPHSANGRQFATADHGSDENINCARRYKGGWWYNNCHLANLNGLYLGGPHQSYADGIEWHAWRGYNYSLKRVEMKIREVGQ